MKLLTIKLVLNALSLWSHSTLAQTNYNRNQWVECSSDLSPLHSLKLHIKDRVESGDLHPWEHHYNSIFYSLSGPRQEEQEFSVVTVLKDITTRVHAGLSINVKIPDYGELQLSDIQYTYNEEWFPFGFSGAFIDQNGESTALTCDYIE